MYTSQLLSLALDAGETEPFAKEIRGTGNENEIRGPVSGPDTGTQVTILSFGLVGSSEKSYLSGGGVYELLGMSSDWEPQYETGGEGWVTGVGAGFS